MTRSGSSDPKLHTLQQRLSLHARAAEVTDPLFAEGDFFDPRDLVQVKYEMLRRVRVDRMPVLHAAKSFGFSRPSFYEARVDFEQAGMLGLMPARRGPRRAHKMSAAVIAFLRKLLDREPALRPADLASRVHARFGVSIHPRTIERGLSRGKQRPP